MADGFPLTKSQTLIRTGQLLSGDQPLYNMAWRFDIAADLDPARFVAAVAAVAAQHDALRLTFGEQDGQPVQYVGQVPAVPALIDLSSAFDPEEALGQAIDALVSEPFDLTVSSWRSQLYRIADNHFVWVICQHHIASDARTGEAFFQAVADAYAGDHARPATQFQDWVQRSVEAAGTDGKVAAAVDHWTEAASEAGGQGVPYGQSRDPFDATSGLAVVPFGPERAAALRRLTQSEGFRLFGAELSRFAVFATIHAAWLSRITNDNSVCFGAPAHLRGTAQDQAAMGMFVETFPFPVAIDPADSFRDLHGKVAAQSMAWLRNSLAGSSTPESAGAFRSVLNYLPIPFGDFAGHPCDVSLLHSGAHDPGHDVQLSICQFSGDDGPIDLHFRLNRKVFGGEFGGMASTHWLALADAMFSNPDGKVASTPLGGEVLVGPECLAAETVLAQFTGHVSATPDAIAIEDRDRRLTYREFDRLIGEYAAGCLAGGVAPGTPVLVWAPRSIETVAAIWGILRAGGVFVPFAASTPAERVQEIARASGIRFAITATAGSTPRQYGGLVEISPAQSGGTFALRDRADQAYIIFTSGSTGVPKGVEIDHGGLADYSSWATREHPGDYAFHSSIGFDLTITSLFAPLISGQRLRVYPETGERDLAVLDVFRDDAVDVVKLTPAHLALVLESTTRLIRIRTLILGGEALSTDLATRAAMLSPRGVTIANEYGPTEAVVGAMLHRFDVATDLAATVSIGRPADGVTIAVLDDGWNPLPPGITGEIYIGGRLARGYYGRPDLTDERFVTVQGQRLYRTGDLARIELDGNVTFLGRADDQMSVRGVRIEPAEIAAEIVKVPGVVKAHIDLVRPAQAFNMHAACCVRCGLSEQAPGGELDSDGVCQTCRRFDAYRERADLYFQTPEELRRIVGDLHGRRTGKYDVIMLLSGGKDSTYALYRLSALTRDILCLTLDNGFLSDEAKVNIRRVADDLDLEHRFMTTEAMNAIFRDSLARNSNVCQGCFKTIYTLSLRIARDEGIPAIATGLSRGQFFETRLTPELFADGSLTGRDLDQMVLAARKSYHQVKDAVTTHLATADLTDPKIFEDVQFIDIFRYLDVPVAEIYRTLDERGWKRPRDTGRSTNCRINDLGIYVHTRREGFHNYSVPYAWDVRMGVKTREEAIAELHDDIDPDAMADIMDEIGMDRSTATAARAEELVAWVVGTADPQDIRTALRSTLPPEFLPSRIIPIAELPLTANGKVATDRLPNPRAALRLSDEFVAPAAGAEEILAQIIAEEIRVPRVGATDVYYEIGGDSLAAIRISLRAGERGLSMNAADIFRYQTVRAIAEAIADRGQEQPVFDDDEPLLDLDSGDLSAIAQALEQ